MRHQAIRNLYPQVVVIQDGIGYFDSEGNRIDIDDALVAVETAKLEKVIELNSYKGKRAQEYPYIGDLADAIYWQSNGDPTKMQEYLANVAAVKEKYPKPASFDINTPQDTPEGSLAIGQGSGVDGDSIIGGINA